MAKKIGSESQVVIRRALSSDKDRVLEFCKNTWPGGDYIPDVWDAWIRGPKGSLLVASASGVPVGLGHYYFQTRKLVWLEGLRVDPAYRGRGIAGKVNGALTKDAVAKGAVLAGLCTGIQNFASRRHVEKVGSKILQRFDRLDSTQALQRKPPNVSRLHKYEPGLWKFVRLQPEFPEFRGLYSDGWTWYPVTPQSLRRSARGSGLVVANSGGETSSVGILSSEGRRLTLGFFAGEKSQAEHVARYSRYLLSKAGFQRVRTLLPHGSSLVGVFKKAAFKNASSILVYQKKLGKSRKKG